MPSAGRHDRGKSKCCEPGSFGSLRSVELGEHLGRDRGTPLGILSLRRSNGALRRRGIRCCGCEYRGGPGRGRCLHADEHAHPQPNRGKDSAYARAVLHECDGIGQAVTALRRLFETGPRAQPSSKSLFRTGSLDDSRTTTRSLLAVTPWTRSGSGKHCHLRVLGSGDPLKELCKPASAA